VNAAIMTVVNGSTPKHAISHRVILAVRTLSIRRASSTAPKTR
jgi:hypothetical protein